MKIHIILSFKAPEKQEDRYQKYIFLWKALVIVVFLTLILLVTSNSQLQSIYAAGPGSSLSTSTIKVKKKDFVRTVRMQGTVEALSSLPIAAPRLAGPGLGSLVVTKLVPSGSQIKKGDLLVEFDNQVQVKNALDRKADYVGFVQQIKKKEADQATAKAADDTALVQAEDAMKSAELELRRNEILSKIDAEKNQAAFEEAKANYEQQKTTYALKRKSAAAEVKSLEIQRDRALLAMQYAEKNTDKLAIHSPMDGIVVLNTVWKGSQMGEVQEGDEVRAGQPFMQVVNAGVMQVRSRINQADVTFLRTGQTARVGLDAYPDLSFPGEVEHIAAIGVTSNMSDKVRTFNVVFAIHGTSPKLMPDLSAAVDVEVDREPVVLVLPRDCIVREGKDTYVMVPGNSGDEKKKVVLGASSDLEVVVLSGLNEGDTVLRSVARP